MPKIPSIPVIPRFSGSTTFGGFNPRITGLAYPAETLVSTSAGQWYKDGVAISGETGSTYVVRVNDIGSTIKQATSNSSVIWHPKDDVNGGIYLGNFGVINNLSAACIDAEAVAMWLDQSNLGYHMYMPNAAIRPLAQLAEVSSNNTVQFDGTSNYMIASPASNALYQNSSTGYIFTAFSDTNRLAGSNSHAVAAYYTPTGSNRIGVFGRLGGASNFSSGSRRLDADTLAFTGTPNTAGYVVATNESFWSTNVLNFRLDGVSLSSNTFSSGAGNTSNTPSISGALGISLGPEYFPGHIAGVMFHSGSVLTSSARSRVERYLGLLVGKNIPLV